MEHFNEVAALIVLLGSVALALDRIFDLLGKPILWTKNQKKRSDEQKKTLA